MTITVLREKASRVTDLDVVVLHELLLAVETVDAQRHLYLLVQHHVHLDALFLKHSNAQYLRTVVRIRRHVCILRSTALLERGSQTQ